MFISPNPLKMVHTAAETLGLPIWVNMISMQGELGPPHFAQLLLTQPAPTTALPGTLVTFTSNIVTVRGGPFLLNTTLKIFSCKTRSVYTPLMRQ